MKTQYTTTLVLSLAFASLVSTIEANNEFFSNSISLVKEKSPKTFLKEGDSYYKEFKLKDAIVSYQEALKGSSEQKVYITRQIAKSYMQLFDYGNAKIWYDKLMEFPSDIIEVDVINYINLLKNLQLYDEAIDIYNANANKFNLKTYSNFETSCKWAKEHINDASLFSLNVTNLQTGGLFLGADFYNTGLMVGNTIQNEGGLKTGFSELGYTKLVDTTTFDKIQNLAGTANSITNDAHPSITADGKTMYFTKNTTNEFFYYPKVKHNIEINQDGISLLNIYVSYNVNGQWSAPKRLSFNSKEFSCAYPFIDKDGRTLYFSSNRPGGIGGFDIYKSVLMNDSSFTEPVNLGNNINSADDDFAPRVYNNKFYFASRGKGGFGGADMFVCDFENANKLGQAVNMGVPFNSSKDDFYILFKENSKEGYFASNRDGLKGEDKLYFFRKLPPPNDTISGIVLDRITNEILKGVLVNLYEVNANGDSSLVKSMTTNETGFWKFMISPEKKYVTNFSLIDYLPRRFVIPITDAENHNNRKEAMASLKVIKLSPIVKKNNIVKINNIYFDFNKANVRSESFSILNNLVNFLNENPTANIELSAHTDAAGNDKYNLKLSDNRAKSCYMYLVANGVDAKRIIPKGYGEMKLLNSCKDAKKCSEMENQLNRRVEVKFL